MDPDKSESNRHHPTVDPATPTNAENTDTNEETARDPDSSARKPDHEHEPVETQNLCDLDNTMSDPVDANSSNVAGIPDSPGDDHVPDPHTDIPGTENEAEREMLVGSPMKSPRHGRRASEEYFDNFDNAITTSLLDVHGPLSPDAPHSSRANKYRPAMKMFLPFRLNKPGKNDMPLPYAGLFSIMTFSWMSSYMWGIYRKGIDNMPTWSCPSQESCAENVVRFEKGWKQELEERGPERSSLARVIRKLYKKRLIVTFCVLFITMAVSFLGPAMVLLWLLEYLASPNIVISHGIVLIVGLSIAEFSRSVFMAAWWFINYQMAIRVRAGVLSMLFRKILRLRTLKDTNIGELINICTNDGQRLFDGVCMVPFLPSIAVVLIFGIVYTALLVGPWALVGMLTFLFFFPVMISISRLTMRYRQTAIKITDQRVSLMSEMLNCIKLIKMYAWERSFYQGILDLRSAERKLLEKAAYTQSMAVSSSPYIPIVSVAVTFIGHTLSGNDLSPAQAFTMLAVLNTLKFSVGIMPYCIKAFAEVIVTFRRIKNILMMEEMVSETTAVSDDSHALEIVDYSATWVSPATSEPADESKNDVDKATEKLVEVPTAAGDAADQEGAEMMLHNGHVKEAVDDLSTGLVDVNVRVTKGKLVGICGPVGSGKSTLLSAILGKMVKTSGSVAVNGSVAYVTQQAWIMNTTVRDNILLGRPYNHERYQTAVESCCLQPDLNDFVAGDLTEIGERGVNLSGGQKQRISLARAVYSGCDIVLLDDPLSAVDVHVGRHIFTECIKKALVGKTVLFVTHQLQYLKYCDHILTMKEGAISESGSHDDLMKSEGDYSGLVTLYHRQHLTHDIQPISKPVNSEDAYLTLEKQLSIASIGSSKSGEPVPDGKLIEAEESSEKDVSWATYLNYMRAAGSPLVMAGLFVAFTVAIGVQTYTSWFLAYWINQGSGNTNITVGNTTVLSHSMADNPDIRFYTSLYGSLIVIIIITSVIRGVIFMKLTLRASTSLHDTVLHKIMRAPMSFFDTTPTGRILNRFSKDMDEIDVFLPFRLETFIQNIFLIISGLIVIAIVSPWFIVALVPLAILFLLLNRLFMASVRAIKRRDNTTRSPLIGHIGASVHGITTIQAYGKTGDFIAKFDELLDANSVPFLLFNLASRWLAVRLDIICVILTAVTALIAVLAHDYISPAMAGLALSFAIHMTGMFQYTIRMAVETEARFTSAERIQEYIQTVTSEAPTESTADKKPDSTWPSVGGIQFKDYWMKYRDNLPNVLKGIDIEVRPGEKVGIVGRTGSGKSSLGVALFRLVEAQSGSILIDGVNIADVGLLDLRSRVSIIPQDPVMFRGTVRYNLDPFSKHADEDIWMALEKCHVKDKMAALPQQLETYVVENGDNFSVGERQLLCMARALLRKSKVLMLDEATAAIDTETDTHVQATLKHAFHTCTILTIAHRLNTVLTCDRIVVMDNGKVVEFDTPAALKSDSDSAFKKMLDVAETRDILLE